MTSTGESLVERNPNSRVMFRSLFEADLIALKGNRRSLILSIVLPLIILLTTSTHKAQQSLGGTLLIIGLAITYGLMSTSMLGYALNVARDRDKGVFQRLRVTPAPTWMIMTSRLGVQVIANLIISLVVVIIGASIHHLTLTPGQYALVIAISIIGGAVFLSIGQALVGLLRSPDTVNAAGRVVFISLALLGIVGLNGALGSAVETASRWSPTGTIMTLFSGVLNLARWSSTDSLSLLACMIYILVFAGIGIRWFSWAAE
ncbi:MAG: ABC transporter permease [Actinomycetota bacterium]|nr:ABC transporter permease [Actinomycetota bacterium]